MQVATPAQQNVTRIILDEHESLAAVIHGMRYFIHAVEQEETVPEPRLFRAMLHYMNDYPERVHHPKEDRYLFARLRKHTSSMNSTLAELEYQHAQGMGRIHGIQHAFACFEFEGVPALPALRDLVEDYARHYFAHMRLEEDDMLTAAARFLTEQDWIEIEAAFSVIPDALTRQLIRNDFAKLFLSANIAPGSSGMAKTTNRQSIGQQEGLR